ncbi:iron-sulfur cluster assembly scaffold protein [Bacillus cereus]|uniref:iron-sulfur cluster assembly scaffold protein n=1 Tax=Bacillus paramycoides TaxID=2026194 RepID=UPI000DCA820B|nr:hypothetical protein A6E25_19495 [Bacillus cereus]
MAFEGSTPGCNDHIVIYLKINEHNIISASFLANSCTLSRAYASVLMNEINGLTIEQIKKINFNIIAKKINTKIAESRIKCSSLAFKILINAISILENEIN